METSNNDEKLVVGFACGWGKDSKVGPGPIGDKIVQRVFDLSVNTKNRVFLIGGNGSVVDKESMREADRMRNEYARLTSEVIKSNPDAEVTIPEVETDTEDYLADISGGPDVPGSVKGEKMARSYSTVVNAENLVKFLQNDYDDSNRPHIIEVVGLDQHMGRVAAIVRNKLKAAGMGDIVVQEQPVKGEFNSTNGQWRLRNETRFKVWNKLAGAVFQRGETNGSD